MKVNLHKIHRQNFHTCLRLTVKKNQSGFIATNVHSLAEAYVNPALRPYGIFDGKHTGPRPAEEMFGFLMLEIPGDGIGFILRLMIDEHYQGKGYGRAAMKAAIQKLRIRMLSESQQAITRKI